MSKGDYNSFIISVYSGAIPSTSFIENLIEGLAKEGVKVYLFGKQYEQKSFPQNVYRYPTPKSSLIIPFFVVKEWFKLVFSKPIKAKALFKYLKSKNNTFKSFTIQSAQFLPLLNHAPDIFHIQWAKMVPTLLPLKPLMNNCWVVSFRGAHINYSPIADPALAAQYKEAFPQIDGFHAVSQAIAQEGAKYGASLNKTEIIKPAVKADLFNEFEAEKPINKQKLQLISVGRFHWKKGYHYALDAMKILKEQGVDFHYTIIAKGDQEEILYQIHDLGLENDVTIIAGLPHEETLQKLKNSDLFLLPSVEEGIANVVLEAMAVGVPVITTNCGGMSEVIQSEENGWLVPIRNSKAIVKAIRNFQKQEHKHIEKIRINAYEKIQESFLVKNQVKAMKTFYKELIKK